MLPWFHGATVGKAEKSGVKAGEYAPPQGGSGVARRAGGVGAGQASAVFDAVSDLRKPMDLPLWRGENRSHAQWHGEDLQRRHGGKDAVLCCE